MAHNPTAEQLKAYSLTRAEFEVLNLLVDSPIGLSLETLSDLSKGAPWQQLERRGLLIAQNNHLVVMVRATALGEAIFKSATAPRSSDTQ